MSIKVQQSANTLLTRHSRVLLSNAEQLYNFNQSRPHCTLRMVSSALWTRLKHKEPNKSAKNKKMLQVIDLSKCLFVDFTRLCCVRTNAREHTSDSSDIILMWLDSKRSQRTQTAKTTHTYSHKRVALSIYIIFFLWVCVCPAGWFVWRDNAANAATRECNARKVFNQYHTLSVRAAVRLSAALDKSYSLL